MRRGRGLDLHPGVVSECETRCADLTNVRVATGAVPDQWPQGEFDLVLLSEVAYYLDADGIEVLIDDVQRSLVPGGVVVVVHWLGETDYPLTGAETHRLLDAKLGLRHEIHHSDPEFALDVWERQRGVRAVAVVIPARNEQAALPAALAAVDARPAIWTVALPPWWCVTPAATTRLRSPKRRALMSSRPQLVARVALVEPASPRPPLCSLIVSPKGVWVASTDADSIVSADWLTTHLEAAQAGWDAYAGEVVVLDWDGWSGALPDAYERRYRHPGRRAPVHGANLGVRLDAYLAVGGFPAVACGEDEVLVERLVEAGYPSWHRRSPLSTPALGELRGSGRLQHVPAKLEQVEASAARSGPRTTACCIKHETRGSG